MLMLIEEVVDQPPILPLVVSELGSGPAAAAAHRRRAIPAVVRGGHTCGALARRLDGTGPSSHREMAGRRAAALLRLAGGRCCRLISWHVLRHDHVPRRANGAGAPPLRQGVAGRAGQPAGRPARPGARCRQDMDGWFGHLRPFGMIGICSTGGMPRERTLLLNRRLAAHHDGRVRHLPYQGGPAMRRVPAAEAPSPVLKLRYTSNVKQAKLF